MGQWSSNVRQGVGALVNGGIERAGLSSIQFTTSGSSFQSNVLNVFTFASTAGGERAGHLRRRRLGEPAAGLKS